MIVGIIILVIVLRRRKKREINDIELKNVTQVLATVFNGIPQLENITIKSKLVEGRNFDEILRVIDSLQLTENHKVATPGNWKSGDDVVIVPSLQDPEEINRRFPKGYTAVKPYLRLTPDPRA